MRENIIKKRKMSFVFEKTTRISPSVKLVPVLYQEYNYGLLAYHNLQIVDLF